jgi:membrane protein
MRHRALIVRPKNALVVRRTHPETREPLWATGLGLAILAVRYARWWKSRPQLRSGRPPSVEEQRRPSRHADPREAVQQRGRGRHATSPLDIPARGWKDILIRTYKEMSDDRVMALAAGVTYYALLAIFPSITAFLSLYGLFADVSDMRDHLATLSTFLPAGAIQIIGDQMQRVASKGDATLGLAFFFGLAIALWSANAGIKALFDALNVVYEETEKRNFFKLNAISLAFTACAILFLLSAIALVAVLPVALDYIGLKAVTEWLLTVLRWPFLFVGTALGIAVIYRYGPSREKAQWRWITWGSATATVLWLAVSMLFSWYAANFGNYDKTYGSLGAAIGFMTWIWMSSIVVLMGAELDAEMEHQTAEDTTSEAPEPMGQRGATMADTVGQAQGS